MLHRRRAWSRYILPLQALPVRLLSREFQNDLPHQSVVIIVLVLALSLKNRDICSNMNADIRKLMHDFNCTDAADMNFKLLADRTRYLKENPKGVSEMCKVIEDMRKEERIEERIEIAKNMLLDGMLSLEKIAEYARLSLDEVRKLQAGQNA